MCSDADEGDDSEDKECLVHELIVMSGGWRGPPEAASLPQCFCDTCSQQRNELLLEPPVARQPAVVCRTRMRQGYDTGPVSAPVPDRRREARPLLGQVVGGSVVSDDQRELQAIEHVQQRRAPARRALRPGRQVARAALAGITKAHGHDGERLGVVEALARNTQPAAQPIAACVVEWNTRLMHFSTRYLRGDQDAR